VKKPTWGKRREQQMKKILSILLVIATMLTVCMSLVACHGPKPNLNLDKAKKNLKKNDYYVEICDGDEWDDFYEGGLMIEEVLYAEDDGDNYLVIYKCKTVRDAKLLYKLEANVSTWAKYKKYVLKKFGDDMEKDDRKSLEEFIENDEESVWGRSGKYVWYGTKDAAKDSKG
jgi:hypothetical protein